MTKFIMRSEQHCSFNELSVIQRGLLLADPGTGKTGTLLHIMKSRSVLGDRKWMIFAPPKVIATAWPQHLDDFEDFQRFSYSIVNNPVVKKREAELQEDVDIYLVPGTLVKWAATQDTSHITSVIIDEVDKFSGRGPNYKNLILNLNDRDEIYGATGTPCATSIIQLWPISFMIDQGASLGKNVTAFRNKWFTRGGYQNYSYLPKPNAEDEIAAAMVPYTSTMINRDVTKPQVKDIIVPMDAKIRKQFYNIAKRKKVLAEGTDHEYLVEDAPAAYSKMKQIAAGGYIYSTESKAYTILHEGKIKALKDLHSELMGKRTLVFYWYRFEKEIIKKHFKKRVCFLDKQTKAKDVPLILKKWKAGDYDHCFAHPASAGEGIDGLQHGCKDVVWLSLPESLRHYIQGNGRVTGSRAHGAATVHRLITEKSTDEVILERLAGKDLTQREIFKKVGI